MWTVSEALQWIMTLSLLFLTPEIVHGSQTGFNFLRALKSFPIKSFPPGRLLLSVHVLSRQSSSPSHPGLQASLAAHG